VPCPSKRLGLTLTVRRLALRQPVLSITLSIYELAAPQAFSAAERPLCCTLPSWYSVKTSAAISSPHRVPSALATRAKPFKPVYSKYGIHLYFGYGRISSPIPSLGIVRQLVVFASPRVRRQIECTLLFQQGSRCLQMDPVEADRRYRVWSSSVRKSCSSPRPCRCCYTHRTRRGWHGVLGDCHRQSSCFWLQANPSGHLRF
jgi:hypothetical protein